jgi:hypothetical protein
MALSFQHPARHGIELLDQFRIARFHTNRLPLAFPKKIAILFLGYAVSPLDGTHRPSTAQHSTF